MIKSLILSVLLSSSVAVGGASVSIKDVNTPQQQNVNRSYQQDDDLYYREWLPYTSNFDNGYPIEDNYYLLNVASYNDYNFEGTIDFLALDYFEVYDGEVNDSFVDDYAISSTEFMYSLTFNFGSPNLVATGYVSGFFTEMYIYDYEIDHILIQLLGFYGFVNDDIIVNENIIELVGDTYGQYVYKKVPTSNSNLYTLLFDWYFGLFNNTGLSAVTTTTGLTMTQWLAHTLTILTLVTFVVILFFFLKWLFKVVSGLILLKN